MSGGMITKPHLWWESGLLTVLGVFTIVATMMGVHEKLGHSAKGA
jgi:hypothetical protein